jgi:hypothetical protein
MVESIYFLKPAWCGTHSAGLWPEQGLQPVIGATAFRRWFSLTVRNMQLQPPAVALQAKHRGVGREKFIAKDIRKLSKIGPGINFG